MSQRVALVTGGTGGVGTAICTGLANAGYRVVAGDISAGTEAGDAWVAQMRDAGTPCELVYLDVADIDNCTTAIPALEASVGPTEVLVNCAGITRDGTFRKMDVDQWRAVLGTNLDSVFNVTRQVVNGMLERGFGRVVNISSLNGVKGQFGQANYSAAKAGMHGFTMAIAQEVARKGITVNTVSPGYLATQMVMAVPEEVRKGIISQIPVGRLGEPSEIADAVVFLARDESGYITGMNLNINGGQHMQH
jgi:acetoacetyl-CoA reductase